MNFVIAAAAGALLSLTAYNRSVAADPVATNGKVVSIRQAISVVLAIAEGIWSLLDALAFATRPAKPSTRLKPRFASGLASDED